MKRFGVIGHPSSHSLSPVLHRRAFELLGLDCSYDSFDVPPGTLRGRLDEFREQGFRGLNVTLPHKEDAARIATEISDEARVVGAVNTLSFEPGRLVGDNTDVYGFAASLEAVRGNIERRPVLILGAGGSARAIVYALLTKFKPSGLSIANRTLSRAKELETHFRPFAGSSSLESVGHSHGVLQQLVERAGLVVHCTPVGMFPSVDECPVADEIRFHADQVVVDLIYTPLKTRLLSLAERQGARTISGLEMFLYQGARSFEIWLGKQMPVDTLRPVIIDALQTQRRERNS